MDLIPVSSWLFVKPEVGVSTTFWGDRNFFWIRSEEAPLRSKTSDTRGTLSLHLSNLTECTLTGQNAMHSCSQGNQVDAFRLQRTWRQRPQIRALKAIGPSFSQARSAFDGLPDSPRRFLPVERCRRGRQYRFASQWPWYMLELDPLRLR